MVIYKVVNIKKVLTKNVEIQSLKFDLVPTYHKLYNSTDEEHMIGG